MIDMNDVRFGVRCVIAVCTVASIVLSSECSTYLLFLVVCDDEDADDFFLGLLLISPRTTNLYVVSVSEDKVDAYMSLISWGMHNRPCSIDNFYCTSTLFKEPTSTSMFPDESFMSSSTIVSTTTTHTFSSAMTTSSASPAPTSGFVTITVTNTIHPTSTSTSTKTVLVTATTTTGIVSTSLASKAATSTSSTVFSGDASGAGQVTGQQKQKRRFWDRTNQIRDLPEDEFWDESNKRLKELSKKYPVVYVSLAGRQP
jgi:hypothetical protein